jgi:hypothetical protein
MDGVEPDPAADRLAKRGFSHIGDDLGVDVAVAWEDAEDDRLADRVASAFTPDPTRPEVRLVDLHRPPPPPPPPPPEQRAPGFTVLGDATRRLEVHGVDRTHRQAGQPGGVRGGQVHREGLDKTAENPFADSGTAVIAVLP